MDHIKSLSPVVAALLLVTLSLTLWGCPDGKVTVPDVVGMTLEEAESTLAEAGLTVGSVRERFTDQVPAGTVLEQTPRAGSRIAADHWVRLVVSERNTLLVSVPDVVDETETDAWVAVTTAGLTAGSVTAVHSDKVPEGVVMSQAPAAGGLALPASPVFLQVSSGLEPGTEAVFLPGGVPLPVEWVPPGTFMMGRYPGEQDGLIFEDPQHEVTLGLGVWMGRYEVTKRQWQAVMGNAPWDGQANVLERPDSPAVHVSWEDAQLFIAALSDHIDATGQGPRTARLPSEAEWEYAARAGTATRFHWGDDPDCAAIDDYAWWYGNTRDPEGRYAHMVGEKASNPFGLYDMAGNAWEWCEDDWHWSYTGTPEDGSSWVESPRADSRVVRGGAWSEYGYYCRSAYRAYRPPDQSSSSHGFRVVLDPASLVAVPDVRGMVQDEAETTIAGAGLVVGAVDQGYSDTTPAGCVLSQDPVPGARVPTGTLVSLVVSLGPEPLVETEVYLLPGDVPLEMVRIPAGAFMMGRYPGERHSWEREDPQHEVTISYDFWMGKYPVTKGQWEAVMGLAR